MSIACLGLLSSINAQGLNVESPNAQLGGTYSNISQSNDAIAGLGIPNATFITGVGASTDPDIPNNLLFACNLNNPVSPNIGILALAPTGGGAVGNGSNVAVAGDFLVAGDIITEITSATSLATDANGKIIAGSAPVNPNFSGKLAGGTIISGSPTPNIPYLTGLADGSLVSIDYSSRVCTVQLYTNGKVASNNGVPNTLTLNPAGNLSILNIEVYPTPTGGQIPFPSDNLGQGVFAGVVVDQNNEANNLPCTFNWVYDSGLGQIQIFVMSATVPQNTAGDTIFFVGTFSYIF